MLYSGIRLSRYRNGQGIIENHSTQLAPFPGPTGMSFILTWLRLSTNRQLDWYRNSSHQSKDIAHVQKTLAQRMADKVSQHIW